MSLYTMSSPFNDELGDWMETEFLQSSPYHRSFMDSLSRLNALEKDQAYKARAIENIKSHPKKYFTNWVANIGRLLFSYPYSYKPQSLKTYFTFFPNIFVVILILFASAVSLLNLKKIPPEILVLLIFIIVYLFGSSLVSAYRRMFYITLPFWTLFVAYAFDKFISIKIRRS